MAAKLPVLLQLLCINVRVSMIVVPKDQFHVGRHLVSELRGICGIVVLVIISQ